MTKNRCLILLTYLAVLSGASLAVRYRLAGRRSSDEGRAR